MVNQQYWRRAKHLLARKRLLRLRQQAIRQTRFKTAAALQCLKQQTFQRGIQANHLHFFITGEPLLRNSPS